MGSWIQPAILKTARRAQSSAQPFKLTATRRKELPADESSRIWQMHQSSYSLKLLLWRENQCAKWSYEYRGVLAKGRLQFRTSTSCRIDLTIVRAAGDCSSEPARAVGLV